MAAATIRGEHVDIVEWFEEHGVDPERWWAWVRRDQAYGDETEMFQPPHDKDIDEQMLVDLRRMLTGAGLAP